MEILITHQFNKKMKELDNDIQQEVIKIYSLINVLNKDELINSSLLTKIKSSDNNIFTIKGKNIRLFCSFENNSEERIIFLDVSIVKDIPYNLNNSLNNEISLFDINGNPIAYIVTNDDNTIYTFNGIPTSYIDNQNNIYGFNGKHLGWFEDNIIYDHDGNRVGFTKTTVPTFTSFEPFKGFKNFKPFKGFKEFAPFKPIKGFNNSNIDLLKFLEQGI